MDIVIAFIAGFFTCGVLVLILDPENGSRLGAISRGDYLGYPHGCYPGPTEPAESDSPPTPDDEITT